MAAKRKNGRPTRYDWRYCDRLVEHLAKGLSFESFGAEVGVHRDTLYAWAKAHAKFSDAKKLGEAHRAKYLLRMGQGIALGTHRYLAAEVPVTHNGQEVRGSDGQVLIEKIYKPSRCNAAVWIFMAKNMMGWHDSQNVNLAGQKDAPPIAFSKDADMSREERLAELAELARQREELGDD